MLCAVFDPTTYKWRYNDIREPVCGEDFCDQCGDCLDCYNGDGCMVGGEWDTEAEHRWHVYEAPEETKDWLSIYEHHPPLLSIFVPLPIPST